MAKIYPPQSVLTVRQRVEKLHKTKRTNDPIVTIHNCHDGDGTLLWFYLSDFEHEDFSGSQYMDYRVNIETKSKENIVLGIEL